MRLLSVRRSESDFACSTLLIRNFASLADAGVVEIQHNFETSWISGSNQQASLGSPFTTNVYISCLFVLNFLLTLSLILNTPFPIRNPVNWLIAVLGV